VKIRIITSNQNKERKLQIKKKKKIYNKKTLSIVVIPSTVMDSILKMEGFHSSGWYP
jgi:hypothetical protein